MRKTSIICSLGPRTRTPEMIEALIGSGMDVARINMAHDVTEKNGRFDFGAHETTVKRVREVSKKLGRPVGILQDISGLKLRVGALKGGKMELSAGDRILISPREIEGERRADGIFQLSLNFSRLVDRLAPGQSLLVDDGKLTLEVEEVSSRGALCRALSTHVLWQGKGINIPDFPADLPVLTARDRASIIFGIEQGVDLVGVSFVRNAGDILNVRDFLERNGAGDKPLVAKIEKKEALDNLEGIVETADGLMVARGDLGVEMDLASLPAYQERIIREARARGKPVIVATQMLFSMVGSDRPTRAEVSDVGNSVRQDCDALMLSDETAGLEASYPVEAVRWLTRIIEASEGPGEEARPGPRPDPARTSELLCAAIARLTREASRIRGILCRTSDGGVARMLAAWRPACPIFALGDREELLRPLMVVKGIVVLDGRKSLESQRQFFREKFDLDLDRDTFIVVNSCPEEEKALDFRVEEEGISGLGPS